MGGQLPLVNHFLQHTLRTLCGEPLHWVYSIFWRILPRHYPPPVWESEAGPFDRSKGNKRNWILVWEDGYCDFVACSRVEVKERKNAEDEEEAEEEEDRENECYGPLQPELFFKMSHDVYNYGEGLMGKIAADKSHKWIFRDSVENEHMPLLSAWQASTDCYPRTWEAQFKAGIQTIAIIAVGEGLLQLGSTKKVPQDVDFALMMQRKFIYLQSIPGVFAQTTITRPINAEGGRRVSPNPEIKQLSGFKRAAQHDTNEEDEACSSCPMMRPLNMSPLVDMPSMYNSLQVLLSKLPAVTPDGPMGNIGKAEATAVNASYGGAAGALSRMRIPTHYAAECYCPLRGRLSGGGLSLPPMTEACPADLRQSLQLRLPAPHPQPQLTLSSANLILPNLADEFESYPSLLGQLIS